MSFKDVIETILYYKDCSNSKLISDFCTFHIIFDMNHFPKNIPHHETLLTRVKTNKEYTTNPIDDNVCIFYRVAIVIYQSKALSQVTQHIDISIIWSFRSILQEMLQEFQHQHILCLHLILNYIQGIYF